jgi:hypothetical protein
MSSADRLLADEDPDQTTLRSRQSMIDKNVVAGDITRAVPALWLTVFMKLMKVHERFCSLVRR